MSLTYQRKNGKPTLREFERPFIEATADAMRGKRTSYWCVDRKHAKSVFDDYVRWLERLGIRGWEAHKSILTVCFDGGGEMRFVVWMGLEEVKCFYMGEE